MSKAFAFDIDGVLLRGGKVLPGAKRALELLNKRNVPWIVLTNGGGTHERDRVAELSERLGTKVDINQFLQSHTPFKDFVGNYKRILAIGGKQDNVREIAQDYGFPDVVIPKDIAKTDPQVHAFPSYTSTLVGNARLVDKSKPFDAVFVFHDSWDISFDSQIVIDLLLSQNGQWCTRREPSTYESKPSIPIYFSNADLQWVSDFGLPRFGQGSFIKTVETLYEAVTEGHKLTSTRIGKPTALTYKYAGKLLQEWSQQPVNQIFMIGDNQYSDISGANNTGWDSVLVRSGVYKDGDKMFTKPTFVEDNVYDAVERALSA